MINFCQKKSLMRQIYEYSVFIVAAFLIIFASIGSLILIFNCFFGVEDLGNKNYYGCKYQSSGALMDQEFGNVDEISMSKEQIEKHLNECKRNQEAFKQAYAINELKRKGVIYLSVLLVAVPVYVYHYRMIKRG